MVCKNSTCKNSTCKMQVMTCVAELLVWGCFPECVSCRFKVVTAGDWESDVKQPSPVEGRRDDGQTRGGVCCRYPCCPPSSCPAPPWCPTVSPDYGLGLFPGSPYVKPIWWLDVPSWHTDFQRSSILSTSSSAFFSFPPNSSSRPSLPQSLPQIHQV